MGITDQLAVCNGSIRAGRIAIAKRDHNHMLHTNIIYNDTVIVHYPVVADVVENKIIYCNKLVLNTTILNRGYGFKLKNNF